MLRSHTLARTIAVALTLGVMSAPACAEQFEYTLRTGIEHSDNITLSQTNPVSQNTLIPGMDFSYQQQGSTVQANVIGMLEYRDYLGNAYANQTLGALTGNVVLNMVPQRLDMVIQDTAAVEPVSTFALNTPSNQQQINVFTLGPTLHFGLGQETLHGQADVRYINSRASKTNAFDSSRGLAAVHLIKDIDAVSNLSLNVQTQRVNFNGGATNSQLNYTRTDVYAQYQNQLHYFDVRLVVGKSWLNFKIAPTVSSPMARLNVDWKPDTHNTFSLAASRQYTDSASDLQAQPGETIGTLATPGTTTSIGNPLINTGNAVITSQAYLARRLDATYAYDTDLFGINLSPFYRKLDYPNNPTFNQKGKGGTLGAHYRLTPLLTLSAFANTETIDYLSLQRRDKRSNYGLSLVEQRTPHWSWRLTLNHRRQTSTQAGLSYHENLIYLGVAYTR